MNNILEINNLNKTYKIGKLAVPVLFDINLQVKKGELIAIIGPSGSGKSTLMNIIGLLDRPTTGEIKIDGEPITLNMSDKKLARLRAEKIGFVFQSFNLLPKQNALENILLPTNYSRSKSKNRAKALELLQKVHLEHRLNHKPTEMSGGEKQRIAIARALINDPDIILADEPTGNLDSTSGQQIMEILQDLNNENKTILVITHDERVAKLCQKTIRIFDGRIVEEK